MYAMDFGSYPNDSHQELPSAPEIEQDIEPRVFNAPTVFGGSHNWEGPNGYPYAGISVFASGVSDSELTRIDGVVDDGSLSTGHREKHTQDYHLRRPVPSTQDARTTTLVVVNPPHN